MNLKAFEQKKKKEKKLSTNEKTHYEVAKKKKKLQYMQLTRGYYPKHTNSACNSISKKQATQTKNGQRTFIDISPNKTYRWPTKTKRCSTSLIIREMQI